MAIETIRYIRKPLYVDAVKVTEENFIEISQWCQGEIRVKTTDEVSTAVKPDPDMHYVRVRVHNPKNVRQTKAMVGDWILYTDRGYKVYTEKAFFASFDKVPTKKQVGSPSGSQWKPKETPENVPADNSPYRDGDAADVGEVQS